MRVVRRAGAPRYGLLLVCASLSFAVQGAISPGPVQQVVVTVLAAACLLLALRDAQFPQLVVRVAAVACAIAIGVAVVRATAGGIGDGAARVTNAALLLIGPPAVAVGVIRDVRAQGSVRLQAVMGVLALYLLVGLLYGFIYGAVDQLGGAPFFAGHETATVAHCVYFSFTTLATVGYGDFVARSDLGHTLAISEGLLGQIYLVTIVSLLVSNLAPGRQARR